MASIKDWIRYNCLNPRSGLDFRFICFDAKYIFKNIFLFFNVWRDKRLSQEKKKSTMQVIE